MCLKNKETFTHQVRLEWLEKLKKDLFKNWVTRRFISSVIYTKIWNNTPYDFNLVRELLESAIESPSLCDQYPSGTEGPRVMLFFLYSLPPSNICFPVSPVYVCIRGKEREPLN